MSTKSMFVYLFTVSLSVVVGIMYLTITLFLQGRNAMALLLLLTMFAIVWKLSVLLTKLYGDLKRVMPISDERTKKVRLYAAGYAYFISLYIWLILFMFHKYLDYDDSLMFGLIGMALSFGLSWLFVSRRKGIE